MDFKIIVKQRGGWVNQDDHNEKFAEPNLEGTVKRGSATCPCCGYTTPVARVREQLKTRHGGTNDGRLYCIVTTQSDEQGRSYRLVSDRDASTARQTGRRLDELKLKHRGVLSLVPDESTESYHSFVNRGPIYGMVNWGNFFTTRQSLVLATLSNYVQIAAAKSNDGLKDGFAPALQTCLAFVVDRMADGNSSLSRWQSTGEKISNTFGRQALPMVWDFCEANPFCEATRSLISMFEWIAKVCEQNLAGGNPGHASMASATKHPLPDDAAQAIVTDPPYYYSVQYADLSDFFYVWLRRTVGDIYPELFEPDQTPKPDEIIVQSPGHQFAAEGKNNSFYESRMSLAMKDSRRVLSPLGIGVVVFAHTSTSAWESQIQAMLDAGWIVTGSWPIDTEMASRVIAQGRSVLASSIHLVCRPRENPDGSVRTDEIGDWRDVLQALPRRIHEWMPRLAEEGVVGADAIFACLGPALEIFSRYSRVEKASGEAVTLKEYLEQVWAAVAKEALALVFKDADATGFEEDARLTAMWLWTLNAGNTDAAPGDSAEDDEADDESEGSPKKVKATGFILEYDAARKIAQGLGAHLEDLGSLVEISGETARLLPVGERANHLFGKDEGKVTVAKKKKVPQLDLFKALEQADEGGTTFGETKVERHGATVLDRIHQSMILFAAGRSEAMKRFLVEDGAGRDQRFWRLAQALSALYPSHTEEKRWVDGVLARKKGLGF